MGFGDGTSLGKTSGYVDHYDASLLFAIARQEARHAIGIDSVPPFHGEDVWNAWELSWLSLSGKPEVALAEIRVPAASPLLVESKSLKLYLNGFANTRFDGGTAVATRIVADLSALLQTTASVIVRQLDEAFPPRPTGICIDALEVDIDRYDIEPAFLSASGNVVSERLYSNLLRGRCPVTGQPDWATLSVDYTGSAIDRAGLLRYLVSFRNHQGFHEQLVERIFTDLLARCRPERLTVYGRFTRRGGIDINPWRSTTDAPAINWREPRQ